jgi:FAD dependent oxidoreductase
MERCLLYSPKNKFKRSPGKAAGVIFSHASSGGLLAQPNSPEMTPEVDAIVIGTGVVGLAVARAFSLSGLSVVVLECEASFGTSTSSRNSEVIHAGLYYPTGSLKAQLCVDGRRKLYAYAAERGVPLRRCGKLVVASDESEIGVAAFFAPDLSRPPHTWARSASNFRSGRTGKRIARGVFDVVVARHSRDAEKIDLWVAGRQQNGDRVVVPRIAVQDDLFHDSHPCWSQPASPLTASSLGRTALPDTR